jgi:hypothetical protein
VPVREAATGKILRTEVQTAPEELFKVRAFFGQWATLIAVEGPTYACAWPTDYLTKKEN